MRILQKEGNDFKDVKKSLYAISLMILFWSLFDNVVQYITPILLSDQGMSNTLIGIIIASSSVFGAVFDFLVYRLFKNTTFRRIFLMMFIVCAAFALTLFDAKSIWLYIVLMAIWGLYVDISNFGVFDFVGRMIKENEHSQSFGVINVFIAVGTLLAPIIIGIISSDSNNIKTFALLWLSIGVSFIFYIILLFLTNKHTENIKKTERKKKKKNAFFELKLLLKLTRTMLSPLIITLFIYIIDAFFWTLAPLYAESNMKNFGNFFLVAYSLPPLIIGWFVGNFTKRFGKKKTAIFGIMIGSLILASISFIANPIMMIAVTFIASCFIVIAIPSINGAYADYISEANYVEGEIEALEDFSYNLGYILGPLIAGILSDLIGIGKSFSVLGIAGFFVALVLIKVTPKEIKIKV